MTNQIIAWRIYYADESVVEGRSFQDWVEAPDEGVLVVVEIYEKDANRKRPVHTIQTHAGRDYYWMQPDGLVYDGRAREIPEDAHVKTGVSVSNALFLKVYKTASAPPLIGTV